MSAFLGPIHHTMYKKILLQDRMSEALLTLAAQQGWAEGLRAQVDAAAPAAPDRPLEEIINASNIHGWLSRAVSGCETRFAQVATALLENHPERMEPLRRALSACGAHNALHVDGNAPAAFSALTALLLDGMPCDRPLAVQSSLEDCVTWTVGTCPHAPYWQSPSVDTNAYYALRAAFTRGMLEHSGFVYTQAADGTFTLKKEIEA